jgi:prolipoprotein diacylglyceryl transferase
VTLGSIPSPPRNVIELGPLDLHVYGLAIAIGALVAILVARTRYGRYGGDPAQVARVGLWAIVAGVVGSRLAHVSTNLPTYIDDPLRVFAVWRGGLALYGGLLFGVVAGIWLARRRGGDVARFLDACAVGIPTAQIFGRFGNYFNQELYGYPTDVPWALEIDPENRLPEVAEHATFHPTFLYEQLWNLGIVASVLLLERRRGFVPGNAFVGYLALYGIGRFVVEQFRIDTAFRLFGLSRNAWVALLLAAAAGAVFIVRERRAREIRRPDGSVEPVDTGA